MPSRMVAVPPSTPGRPFATWPPASWPTAPPTAGIAVVEVEKKRERAPRSGRTLIRAIGVSCELLTDFVTVKAETLVQTEGDAAVQFGGQQRSQPLPDRLRKRRVIKKNAVVV